MSLDANKVQDFIRKDLELAYEEYKENLRSVGKVYVESLRFKDSKETLKKKENEQELEIYTRKVLDSEVKVKTLEKLIEKYRNNLRDLLMDN